MLLFPLHLADAQILISLLTVVFVVQHITLLWLALIIWENLFFLMYKSRVFLCYP